MFLTYGSKAILANELGNGFSHIHYLFNVAKELIKKGVEVHFIIPSTEALLSYKKRLDENDRVYLEKMNIYDIFPRRIHITHYRKKSDFVKIFETGVSFPHITINTGIFSTSHIKHYFNFYESILEKLNPDIIISDRSLYLQAAAYKLNILDRVILISAQDVEIERISNTFLNYIAKKENNDICIEYDTSMTLEEAFCIQELNKEIGSKKIDYLKDIFPHQIISKATTFPKKFHSKLLVPENLSNLPVVKLKNDVKRVYLYLIAGRDKHTQTILECLSEMNVEVVANIKNDDNLQLIKASNIEYLNEFINQTEFIKDFDLVICSGANSLFESILSNKPCLYLVSHILGMIDSSISQYKDERFLIVHNGDEKNIIKSKIERALNMQFKEPISAPMHVEKYNNIFDASISFLE